MSERDEEAVVARVVRDLVRANGKGLETTARNWCHVVLTALYPGDRLPGGGVWTPVEPTEAMLQAAVHWNRWQDDPPIPPQAMEADVVGNVYRAMIAAAAEPTTREPHADER